MNFNGPYQIKYYGKLSPTRRTPIRIPELSLGNVKPVHVRFSYGFSEKVTLKIVSVQFLDRFYFAKWYFCTQVRFHCTFCHWKCLIQGQPYIILFYSREKVTVQIQNNHDDFVTLSKKIFKNIGGHEIEQLIKNMIDFRLIDARKGCEVLNPRRLEKHKSLLMTSLFRHTFQFLRVRYSPDTTVW